MWHLIAQVGTGSDPVEWLQFGAPGLVVIGLLTGWLWPKPAVDRIIKENDALRHRANTYEHEVLAGIRDLHEEIREMRGERSS